MANRNAKFVVDVESSSDEDESRDNIDTRRMKVSFQIDDNESEETNSDRIRDGDDEISSDEFDEKSGEYYTDNYRDENVHGVNGNYNNIDRNDNASFEDDDEDNEDIISNNVDTINTYDVNDQNSVAYYDHRNSIENRLEVALHAMQDQQKQHQQQHDQNMAMNMAVEYGVPTGTPISINGSQGFPMKRNMGDSYVDDNTAPYRISATTTAAAAAQADISNSQYERSWNCWQTEQPQIPTTSSESSLRKDSDYPKDQLPAVYDTDTYTTVAASPCFQILKEVKQDSFAQRGIHINDDNNDDEFAIGVTSMNWRKENNVLLPKRPLDYALSLGRSFRVGWAPDGSFVHAGQRAIPIYTEMDEEDADVSNSNRFDCVVENVRSLENGAECSQSLECALQVYLEHSTNTTTSSGSSGSSGFSGSSSNSSNLSSIPLWEGPKECSVGDNSDEKGFVRMMKSLTTKLPRGNFNDPQWTVWQCAALVDATAGQEEAWITNSRSSSDSSSNSSMTPSMPVYTSAMAANRSVNRLTQTQEGRRIQSVSEWFRALIRDSPDADVNTLSFSNNSDRILHLMTCGRLEDAVEEAENTGAFRLALLLSQIGSFGDPTTRMYIQQQLIEWRNSGTIPHIDPVLFKIYLLLAGDLGYQDLLTHVPWYQALTAVFFYLCDPECGSSSMSEVLEFFYQSSNEMGQMQYPSSLGGETYGDTDTHAIFALLMALYGGIDKQEIRSQWIIDCLRSGSYSACPLDYSGALITELLLESMNVTSASDLTAAITRQHVVSQLLHNGRWELAIYVCLQVPDAWVREQSVKGILERWMGVMTAVTSSTTTITSNDIGQLQQEQVLMQDFCVNNLGIDERMLFEAQAYAHRSNAPAHFISYLSRGVEAGATTITPTSTLDSNLQLECFCREVFWSLDMLNIPLIQQWIAYLHSMSVNINGNSTFATTSYGGNTADAFSQTSDWASPAANLCEYLEIKVAMHELASTSSTLITSKTPNMQSNVEKEAETELVSRCVKLLQGLSEKRHWKEEGEGDTWLPLWPTGDGSAHVGRTRLYDMCNDLLQVVIGRHGYLNADVACFGELVPISSAIKLKHARLLSTTVV